MKFDTVEFKSISLRFARPASFTGQCYVADWRLLGQCIPASANWYGADHSIVPISIAQDVDAQLYADDEDAARGVGGQQIAIVPGRVEVELIGDGGSYLWTAIIGFAKFATPDDECSILGHAGCLEYFLAEFDGVQHAVELTRIAELLTTK